MARRLACASGLFGSLRALATDRVVAGVSDELASVALTTSSGCRAFGSSASGKEGENIDFGFKQVPRDAKQGLVGQVFSSVANSYDVMNDLMSGGLHRLWKDRLVESLRPFPGQEHLDVAGGTGDVGFRVLRAIRAAEAEERLSAATASGRSSSSSSSSSSSGGGGGAGRKPAAGASAGAGQAAGLAVGEAGPGPGSAAAAAAGGAGAGAGAGASAAGARGAGGADAGGPVAPGRVVVCDINPDMLRVGQQKARSSTDLAGDTGLAFVEGNAEALPFASGSFDSYTVAFGIRNVTDRPAALREALRVLKPGGRLLVLEFSHVTQPGLRELYDAYSFAVIPRIGGLVAGDAASYQYLVESIRKFPDQETFARMIEDAGFRAVTYENMSGGIVALHSGFKL